jgi:imidazolonepropionase-like amidohydrolase
MFSFRWLFLAFFFPGILSAQSPVPAQAQKGAVLILGATAHLGNGKVLPNAAIAFQQGKITMVADATTIRIDRNQFAQIYDASGKHVYPGLIATDSQLGLVEIEAVRATVDQAEVGAYNPNARALIAYNTDSHITPTVRSNGVLLAQICPVGGVLSGSSSVVQLDAWNWEDAAVRVDEGQHLNWPSTRSWGGWESGSPEQKANDQYAKQLDAITDLFESARAYAQLIAPAVVNPRFEAMRPLFQQKQTLYIHANEAGQLRDAVYFAERMGLKMVLVGATDAWQETTLLREKQVPVIIARTQRLPSREDEAVDLPYKTPALLHAAGIRFAFSEDGSWKQRNLAFQAGQAVGAGLPYEAAITALTLEPARMMGIDHLYGSIETGKSATLLISDGDILDMRTNRINAAFIDGRSIDLDNKQKELSRKYQEKYDRKKQE